jgi:hypothetical protein
MDTVRHQACLFYRYFTGLADFECHHTAMRCSKVNWKRPRSGNEKCFFLVFSFHFLLFTVEEENEGKDKNYLLQRVNMVNQEMADLLIETVLQIDAERCAVGPCFRLCCELTAFISSY